MSEFKLSATLTGHEDDVRAVAFPSPTTVLSASRDGTVRNWTLSSGTPIAADDKIALQATSFINSLAYVRPSKLYPEGLIASAGKDTVIDVRKPGSPPDQNAERLLLGHAHNVCTLDSTRDGLHLVSGGWDKQARVWDIEKGVTIAELKGHEASVWAVLAYDDSHIITGCADKHIRIFAPQGKLLQDIAGLPDVVRALVKLPPNHSSGAAFASAGNDQIIRLWTLDGLEVAEFHGHEAFIYSLAVLPTGEIVSSSEDRTVRVWQDGQCIQTITHPAISVWSVAVNSESGDLVTGASDKIVRVFTRAAERSADAEAQRAFLDSVKASSIPQQTQGDGQKINKESLPGPDFLTSKSGTKEGQVQMIREDNGNVTAHTWSSAAQQWINVGTVVDAAGSSGRKTSYDGQDYDYVFDVDIEDGKPPLKLPYNANQNPYEVAQKFIANNELPITYLDQVANFILQNTQGASIGTSSDARPPGRDPWGTENRYRPGEVGSAPAPAENNSRPKALPQTQFLSITSANLPAIRRKTLELNDSEDTNKLSSDETASLEALFKQLQATPSDPKPQTSQLQVITKMVTSWAPASRLPGLDILRLASLAPSFANATTSDRGTIVDTLVSADVFSEAEDRPNNTMMAVRVLVNLFSSSEGRLIVDGTGHQTLDLVRPFVGSPNKNLTAAIATLLINYAVLLTSSAPADESSEREQRGALVVELAAGLVKNSSDSETIYRGLVALGTTLSLGQGFRKAILQSRDIAQLSQTVTAGAAGKEPRVKGLVDEIKDLLK